MSETIATADEKTSLGGNPRVDETDDFVPNLARIYQHLKYNKKLPVAMREVEQELLQLLDAKLLTIYQWVNSGKELLATVRSGDKAEKP